MILNVEFIYFLLMLVRVTSLFFISPLFTGETINTRVKLGFSFVVAFMMFNTVPKNYEVLENLDFLMFTIFIIKELLIGLIIGYFMLLIFSVVQIAAEMSSSSMGFMMASTFDPMTQSQTPVLGQMNNLFLLGLFLTYGIHRKIIYYLSESFYYSPVGKISYNVNGITNFFIDNFIYYFKIAVQMSLPIVGVLLLVDLTLGILARIAPQMNVFFVGMPLKLMIAFLFLAQLAPYFVNFSSIMFEKSMENLKILMKLLEG